MGEKYIYTKKGEEIAKARKLDPRPAGEPAMCGYKPVTGLIAQAWLEKGYISIAKKEA